MSSHPFELLLPNLPFRRERGTLLIHGGLRRGSRPRGWLQQYLDGECNTLSLRISAQHLHLDDLSRFHSFGRIFDEAIRKLAYVDQSI